MSLDPTLVKQEPGGEHEACEPTGLLLDEVRVKEELIAKASCVQSLDELYADHVIKDELVLGPERPHRPTGGYVVQDKSAKGAANPLRDCFVKIDRLPLAIHKRIAATVQSAQNVRDPPPPLKDCYVRLERLFIIRRSGTRSSCSEPQVTSTKSSNVDKRPKINTGLRQKVKTNCKVLGKKKNKVKKAERQPYICDTCGKVCKFRHTIIQHLRYHLPDTLENLLSAKSGIKPYYCEICETHFSSLVSIKRHLNIHAGKKRHTCEVCGKKFLESNCYKRHKLTHSTDRPFFPCDICKKPLTSLSALKVHKRNVHLQLKLYSCDICENKYSTSDTLRKHRLSHFEEMPYVCDICDKKFRSIDRLRFHKRTHMSVKPYPCKQCNKGFISSYELSKHKLTHDNEAPNTCKTCKKVFGTSSELDEHKRITKDTYRCVICDKAFCKYRYLRKHKRNLHGVKENTFCEMCRIDFKTSSEFNQHKSTHNGYSCGVCQKNFSDNISLRKHKVTHIKEEEKIMRKRMMRM